MYGLGVNKLGTTNASGFNPASLFQDGSEGAWYDFTDKSQMFKEDGTTPAVQAQEVGKVLDKSGNGHHLVQTTQSKCPVLRVDFEGKLCIDFDSDDGLQSTDTLTFGTDSDTEMTVIAAARKEGDGINQTVAEISPSVGSNKGAFRLFCTSGNLWRAIQKGGYVDETAVANTISTTSVGTATNKSILLSMASIDDPSHVLRRNGSVVSSNTSSLGAGTFGNWKINVGARNNASSAFLDGKIYALIVVAKKLTDAEIAGVEEYMSLKSGVTLS